MDNHIIHSADKPRVPRSGIMNDGSGLKYLLTDHLGSLVVITDENGDLVSQQRYLPFGGIRTNVTTPNSPSTDYGYTGQHNLDADIGLMDYKAHFYSPVLNRFIQPDSIVPNPMNPQAFNRFSYVGNRPINFNDPSGHVPIDCIGSNYCGSAKDPKYVLDSQFKPKFTPKPKKEEAPHCQSRACDPNLANNYSATQLIINNLQEINFQNTCEAFLSGAPLLCDTSLYTSPANYFSSTTQNVFSSPHPLSYFSMLIDISNSRGWTPVRIPVLGSALDYTAQLTNDVGSNGTPTFEHHLRALVVAGEGQVISLASGYASGLSALGSIPTGPGVIIVAVSAYVASSIALSSFADTINNEYIFPALNDITH